MRKELKNMVLLSGSGRNVGKTTLACNIIRHLSESHLVYALKLSPHFHKMNALQILVSQGDGFKVYREMDNSSTKDSAKMLSAGAEKVFFLQCGDENIEMAFESISASLPENALIVCESGSLAKAYKPGLHLLIEGKEIDENKESYKLNRERTDFVVNQNDFDEKSIYFEIKYNGTNWILNI